MCPTITLCLKYIYITVYKHEISECISNTTFGRIRPSSPASQCVYVKQRLKQATKTSPILGEFFTHEPISVQIMEYQHDERTNKEVTISGES